MSTIKFDYNSIKQRIIESLSKKNEWENFLDYGTSTNLIEPIAQEMAYQMQYDEYLTFENWWSKARNKSSLLVQSRVHGYNIPRKRGASGVLTVSANKEFNDDNPEREIKTYQWDIVIPKYFQFSGNGIYFVATETKTLPKSMEFIDIPCRQGEAKTVEFLALGSSYEEKFIEDDSVDNDIFDLWVNDIKYERVDSLFEHDGNAFVYEINVKEDLSGITLRFGNGIFGTKLQMGAKVTFKYISTKGSEGNIYGNNIINTVESQAFTQDVGVENTPVKLYVTNNDSILGGKDYPSMDEIRQLSPRVYQTGDRASSKEDYETLLLNSTSVGKVSVWGVYETNIDKGNDPWTFIPSEENVVHLCALNRGYENLSIDDKNDIIQSIHKKCDPTDIIKFEDAKVIPLDFKVNAIVLNSSYTLDEVAYNIREELSNSYNIEKMEFAQSIHESDFIRKIDEVEGVDYHNSSISTYEEFKFLNKYHTTTILQLHPINYNTVTFYIKNNTDEKPTYEPFAKVNMGGELITTDTKYDISGSTLNLSSGYATIEFNSGLSGAFTNYTLKVVYSLTTNDILLNNRTQILKFNNAVINTSYK